MLFPKMMLSLKKQGSTLQGFVWCSRFQISVERRRKHHTVGVLDSGTSWDKDRSPPRRFRGTLAVYDGWDPVIHIIRRQKTAYVVERNSTLTPIYRIS